MIKKKWPKIIWILACFSVLLVSLFLIKGEVFGYTGPTGPPSSSASYGQMDSTGSSLSIGGRATTSGRLYIYLPDSSDTGYGLRVEANSTPIFRIRNDGTVIVGDPVLSNLSTYKLQAEEIKASLFTSPYATFGIDSCGSQPNQICDNFDVGRLTVSEHIWPLSSDPDDPDFSYTFGSITGFRNLGSLTATFNNTIAASSVTQGVFGCPDSPSCGGAINYNFWNGSLLGLNTSSIAFGSPTSTLMVYGTGYFSSSSFNVSTSVPSNGPGAINLGLGGANWAGAWKKTVRIDSGYPITGVMGDALELGGGTGQNLYGIGSKYDPTSDDYQLAFLKIDPGYEEGDSLDWVKGRNVIGFSSSTMGINNGNLISSAPIIGSLYVRLFSGFDTIVVGKSSGKSSIVARNDNLFFDSTGATTKKIYLSNINQSGDIVIAHAGGKVGISTSSLTAKLNVAGGIKATGFLLSTSTSVGKVLVSDLNGNASWGTLGAGGGVQDYIPKWTASNTLTNSIIFESTGNVGINTSNPGYNLDVNGTFRANGDSYLAYGGQGNINLGDATNDFISINARAYSNITFDNSASTYTISVSDAASGKGTGLIILTGTPRPTQPTSNLTLQSGSGNTGANGNIELETFRNTGAEGFIAFFTYPTYITYPATGTERMRIVNNGNVGIGTSTPAYKLHVFATGTGAVAGFQNSNGTCTITPNTGMSCASDIRLKKNISGIENALSLISSVRGVTFEWKNQTDSSRYYGFIAQELEKVLPEAVSTDADGYKSVSKDTLIPLLAEAIKEQQSELKSIKSDFDFIGQSLSKPR